MAVISTTFKMVDDMSDKLANLGTAGRNVTQELTNIGTSSSSLDEISTSAESAAESLSTVSNVTKNQEEIFENHAESLNKSTQCIENASTELDEYSDMATNAKNMNDTLGESAKGLGDDYDSIGEKVKKTTEETDKFGEENKTVFADLEGIIASAGIVAFLKKVADGYGECIDAASDYETYVAKVSTLADTNVLSIGDMSDEMLDLSQKQDRRRRHLQKPNIKHYPPELQHKTLQALLKMQINLLLVVLLKRPQRWMFLQQHLMLISLMHRKRIVFPTRLL